MSGSVLWLSPMSHFRGDKMEAWATEVACSKPQRLWSVSWDLSSVLGNLSSFSGSASNSSLCEFGKVTYRVGYSPYVCSLGCNVCHSLPCCVSRKLISLPLPPSFRCRGKVGVFILHIPLGQVMVFSVAVPLGHGHGSSHMASLPWLQSLLDPSHASSSLPLSFWG